MDDIPLIRKIVRNLFEAEPAFEVVAEAEDGGQAIEMAKNLAPHLIILDFQMPVMNGLEVAPIILKQLPTVRIIMLSVFVEDEVAKAARNAGIHAFIPKNRALTDLIPTARSLFEPAQPSPRRRSAVA